MTTYSVYYVHDKQGKYRLFTSEFMTIAIVWAMQHETMISSWQSGKQLLEIRVEGS